MSGTSSGDIYIYIYTSSALNKHHITYTAKALQMQTNTEFHKDGPVYTNGAIIVYTGFVYIVNVPLQCRHVHV